MKARFSNVLALAQLPGYPALAFAVLIQGIASSFTYPFMSLFGSTEAHMSPVELGLFMTLIAVSSIMVGTWLGVLSDRGLNRKAVLLLSLACAAVGYGTLWTTHSYPAQLLIGCVFLSVGGSAFPQLFAFARARLGAQQAPHTDLAITTLRTVFSLAWVIGPGVGALLLGALGFRGLFLSAAFTFVLVGVLVMRFQTPPAQATPAQVSGDLRALLRDRRVFQALLSFTLLGTSSAMTMITLPLYVVGPLHGTQGQVGLLLSLAAGLEIPLMLLLGVFASRLDKARVLAWSGALHVTYFAAILLAGRVEHLFPAQLLTAAVVAITAGLGMAFFQDLLPAAPGSATTLFSNTHRLGSILAGVLSGVVASAFGERGVFVLCALLSGTAGLLLFRYSRRGVVPGGRLESAD